MADFDPTDMMKMSRSRGGGASATVNMVTGQQSTSPGPSADFKEPQREMQRDGSFVWKLRSKAQPFTVRFSVKPPNIESTTVFTVEHEYANFDCVAIISYTVEGVTVRRVVTVANGVAISGTADSVNVSIQDITQTTSPQNIPYSVEVQIAPGIRSGYALPPTLEAFTCIVNSVDIIESGPITLVSGQSAVYPVPQQAGVISVEIVTQTNSVNVTMGTVNGAQKQYTVNPGENFGFIVMAPNSAFLTVTGLGTEGVDSIHTATWGIEG
jgi:hypothetical protein